MTALVVLSWVVTLWIVATYALLHRLDERHFHVANVVGAIVLGILNGILGAWPSVLLNSAFGGVAAVSLVRGRR